MAHQNSKCCHKWYTTIGNFLLMGFCLSIKERSQLQNLKVGTVESEKVTIPELENAAQQKDECSSYIWCGNRLKTVYFPVFLLPYTQIHFLSATLLIPLPLVFILPIPSSSPIFLTVAKADGSSQCTDDDDEMLSMCCLLVWLNVSRREPRCTIKHMDEAFHVWNLFSLKKCGKYMK